jgi:hypothetical protein
MRHPNISRYLLSLSHLCAEVAARPELLPVFFAVLRLVPKLSWNCGAMIGG